MTQPSSGGPRYTMETSVFPYTADTEGYKRLSGRPVNNFDKNILILFLNEILLNYNNQCLFVFNFY